MPKTLELIIGTKKKVSEEIAKRIFEEALRAEKRGKEYIMACDTLACVEQHSSMGKFYSILRESDKGFFSHVKAKAFCIDEEYGNRYAYKLAWVCLPPGITIESLYARFDGGEMMIPPDYEGYYVIPNYSYIMGHKSGYKNKDFEISNGTSIFNSGLISAVRKERERYEKQIDSCGGIDLALIELGVNPMHIGSNFSLTYADSRTHLGEKIDKKDNMMGYAMTMGIATLCSAKEAVLFAFGKKKADGVKEFLECVIDENCSPSYLRNMGNLVVALDNAAASGLDFGKLKEIYKDRELKCQNSI